MVNSYVLVNPSITGQFKSEIKAKNSIEAAQKFYKNLSEHFNNSVPKFYFSIHKGQSGSGKYYHFEVNENKNNNEVNFSIQSYKVNNANMKKFSSKLESFKNKIAQTGGKKKHHKPDDSESISSTDSDFDFKSDNVYNTLRTYVPVNNQPFYYWWYDPYVYNLNSLWIPTFYSYVTPYIHIAV